MNSNNSLQPTSLDWRETIRKNNHKTFMVIFLFFLIYFALGLLVDVYLYSGTHDSMYGRPSISEIVIALLTFKLFPIATLIMLGIAGISLLITYSAYDKIMLLGTDYHEIDPNNFLNLTEKQLYNVVEEIKIAAGLRFMPRVYIIEAEYMNAFASGYSEKSAMVAITRGLMAKLNRAELQAVMAHEISHIRHMDIKLTLTASILANLMVIVLDLLFYNALFSRRSDRNNGLAIVIMVLRYLLPILNILLLLYLSRTREYSADAGCVELMRDNQSLATALLKINTDHEANAAAYDQAYKSTPHENVRREAYIFDPIQAGIESTHSFSDLFSTHPSLADRLKAIGFIFNK